MLSGSLLTFGVLVDKAAPAPASHLYLLSHGGTVGAIDAILSGTSIGSPSGTRRGHMQVEPPLPPRNDQANERE